MKNKGFTLIEIVVSMLILSLVVAGSFSLYVTANGQVNNAKHRLQAVNQAMGVLERLRYYVSVDSNNPENSDQALSVNTGISPELIGLPAEPDISDVSLPRWYYDVKTVSGSNCKEVSVSVKWEEI